MAKIISITNSTAGKITIATSLVGLLVFAAVFFIYSHSAMEEVTAQNDAATTTVTVRNTAPLWDVDAEESPTSSTSTPTNSGDDVTWVATASDNNDDPYWLLICKTNATPTPNDMDPPECAGGASDQWAVSSLASSTDQATTTYTTQESDPDQLNNWFAFICDQHFNDGRCNEDVKQGTGDSGSPFVINFRPEFDVFVDDSPHDPGELVTFNATATDSTKNTTQTYDIRLFVCNENDFTGTGCGAGGEWCSSGFSATNPSCSATFSDPIPSGEHDAFGFVLDEHDHTAQGGAHGTDSNPEVNNVAPSILASDVSLLNTDGTSTVLELTDPGAETEGFVVDFTVSDANSCETITGGDEITSAIANVYREGIGQASCQNAGDYDANACYPADVGTGTWSFECTQVGTCGGSGDSTIEWQCTFPLWYIADATDGVDGDDTLFFDEDWFASVQATDSGSSTSNLAESQSGSTMSSFLAFNLDSTAIAYGELEAGDDTPINVETIMSALGNVGLDKELSGTDMCPGFDPAQGSSSCNGNADDTIPVDEQQYATSSVAYGSGSALLETLKELIVGINKPTSTSTQPTGSAFWGIQVPGTIAVAGDYEGQNTILGIKSHPSTW